MEAPPDEPPGRVPPSTPQVLAPLPLPSTLPFSARLRDAPVTVVDEKSQVSLVLPALGVRVEVERLLADRAWIRCTGCRTESAGWVQRNLLLAGRPESSRRADALVAFLEQTAHPADGPAAAPYNLLDHGVMELQAGSWLAPPWHDEPGYSGPILALHSRPSGLSLEIQEDGVQDLP